MLSNSEQDLETRYGIVHLGQFSKYFNFSIEAALRHLTLAEKGA
jgi:hypothetical protein